MWQSHFVSWLMLSSAAVPLYGNTACALPAAVLTQPLLPVRETAKI